MRRKIDFQDGYHSQEKIPGSTTITSRRPSQTPEFGDNWPFGSGEAKHELLAGCHRNDLSLFLSASHPTTSYQVSSQLAQGLEGGGGG